MRTAFRSVLCVLAVAAAACSTDDIIAPPVPGALSFDALSAGYYHTCGLSGGRAYCWGGNDFGTLGDGTRSSRTAPVSVTGGLRFSALDAGAGHNCAITPAGAPWCWGQNDEGQSGDGTFAVADEPVPVTGGHSFRSISAGHAHSCGLTGAGVAYCWGDDSRGQLGNGAPNTGGKTSSPVQVQFDGEFAAVYAGYYQSCGLTGTGEAYCWGLNDQGQNGNDDDADVDVPVAVGGGLRFDVLAPGDRFVCGVADREAWCWGANRHGELGAPGQPSAVPVKVAAGRPVSTNLTTSMGASTIAVPAFACATDRTGEVLCWGGAAPPLLTMSGPATLASPVDLTRVTAGPQHLCAIGSGGFAYCGGANGSGQLGTGSTAPSPSLAPVRRPET